MQATSMKRRCVYHESEGAGKHLQRQRANLEERKARLQRGFIDWHFSLSCSVVVRLWFDGDLTAGTKVSLGKLRVPDNGWRMFCFPVVAFVALTGQGFTRNIIVNGK